MIAIVCGARDWEDVDYIYDTMSNVLRYGDVVIHGGAPGADAIAEMCANVIVGPDNVIRMPADWEKYGRAAGPRRNAEMLKALLGFKTGPKVVYAYHPYINNSKGTRDMVRRAESKKVKVHLLTGVRA